jgi:hypothetical protein
MMRLAWLILSSALAVLPAGAAERVDLALVLAVDVSRSIDSEEFDLQKRGYAMALTDPRIMNAVRSGPNRSIAVAYVEWSDVASQQTVVDWSVIADEESAQVFASTMLAAPRSFWDRTSISGAIDYSAKLFGTNRFVADRRVIDVSGDGVNNSGRPSALARDEAVSQGITINGLVIINDRRFPGQPPQPALDEFYMENVIGGLNAFVIVSNSFGDFATAVLSKLIKEIAGAPAHQLAGFADAP